MPEHSSVSNRTDESLATADRLICELRRRDPSQCSWPAVEELLQADGLCLTTVDRDVLTDVVYAEWMLRFEQGESVSHEEYRTRFPMISSQLDRQWTLEQEVVVLLEAMGWDSLTASSADECMEQSPAQIGKYKVICKLGQGGQADVYRAFDSELDRDVVIKLIRPTNANINAGPLPRQVEGIAEGQMLARLSHPNIGQVYDISQQSGRPYIVMEYVQGQSLKQYCELHPLRPRQVARLLATVANAVANAHASGILHLDIKAQNIVIDTAGTPKLIDFGLARLTDLWHSEDQQPGLRGTITSMAPEQARGDVKAIGPATDIFGMGSVLYHLLTGEMLYQGSSTQAGNSVKSILDRACNCAWDRASLVGKQIPRQLASICERALAADPKVRFQSAAEFGATLESFADSPRRVLRIFTAAAIIAVAACVAWFAPKTRPAGERSQAVAPVAPVTNRILSADLRITIHRDDTNIDLTDAVPVQTGTRLNIESHVPADHSVMLFSVNGNGTLQHIVTIPAVSTSRDWRYPQGPERTVKLSGPTGTECLLVIGSADATFAADQVHTAWGSAVEWPKLPDSAVLRLIGRRVTVEQRGRDIGPPQLTDANSTDKITQMLEQFGSRIDGRQLLLEAIAFCHVPSTEIKQ